MEKKIKYRILGGVVVVALVIITLPLFQGGKELVTEKVTVNMPPFPDQSQQVASATDTADLTPTSSTDSMEINADVKANPSEDHAQPVPINRNQVIPEKKPKVAILEQLKMQAEPVKSAPVKSISVVKSVAEAARVAPAVAKLDSSIKSPFAAEIVTHSKEALNKLNNPAWVVQIGSFKNKNNAFRLLNELRAKGYSAFTQQVKTAFGENTRVFVGPELKQVHAQSLAGRLENEMHIHGVVMSYKPLRL